MGGLRGTDDRGGEELLAPGAVGPAVVELQRLLAALELYAGPIDGELAAATLDAVRSLQRRLGAPEIDAVAPALVQRARERAASARADAYARAAEAAESAAACYEEIAASRRADIDAARAHKVPRPTSLLEEEVGASLLAAARSRLDGAAHWTRAAAVDDARATRLARAREAQARAHRSARAAEPWFRAAASGHLAGGDRLQGSRALEGAVKAAALAADALLPD